MINVEKKFFEWCVSEKMRFYGFKREQAVAVVKRMKANHILWKSAFNAWFDQIHPY